MAMVVGSKLSFDEVAPLSNFAFIKSTIFDGLDVFVVLDGIVVTDAMVVVVVSLMGLK